MKSVSGIYSITNKINNYMYVGQSINVYQRLKNHLKEENCVISIAEPM